MMPQSNIAGERSLCRGSKSRGQDWRCSCVPAANRIYGRDERTIGDHRLERQQDRCDECKNHEAFLAAVEPATLHGGAKLSFFLSSSSKQTLQHKIFWLFDLKSKVISGLRLFRAMFGGPIVHKPSFFKFTEWSKPKCPTSCVCPNCCKQCTHRAMVIRKVNDTGNPVC